MQLDVACDESLHLFWRAGGDFDAAVGELGFLMPLQTHFWVEIR
jgi:hypothetical protein